MLTVLPVLSAALANKKVGWGDDVDLPTTAAFRRYVELPVSGGQSVMAVGLPALRLPTFLLVNILQWLQSKDASNVFVPLALFCSVSPARVAPALFRSFIPSFVPHLEVYFLFYTRVFAGNSTALA